MTTWRAFAKLTLSLRLQRRRADGYHDLDSLTVSVSQPHDELTVETGAGRDRVELALSGPYSDGVTAGAENLAARAARKLLDRAPDAYRAGGVRIALHKQIPAGAGLGGGSADAAAVLHAVDRLLALDLSTFELASLGADLGSDVPFCVHGGAAFMRGRGEIIEPTELPGFSVLIAVPPFAIATPPVYRAWDGLGGPRSDRVVVGPLGIGELVNDLEPAAERVEPRLREFREALERAAGGPAILAGSGSACAVLFADAPAANAARDRVEAAGIARVCTAGTTSPTGVEPVEH
jgi:4-diphosphocytidyl-2-C-methyl-D-erythritol kinase